MADVAALVIAWDGGGFHLRRGDADLEAPRELLLGSLPDGVAVEQLAPGAWVLTWGGDRIGVAGSPEGWQALREAEGLQIALVPDPSLAWGLDARYAVPGAGDGVDGPRGVPLKPAEQATFTGSGDELFLYSVEPVPGGPADRWGWLARRFRRGRPPASR